MAPTPASVIYPELPDPLTPGDLQQLFSPSFDERQWAPTVVRATASRGPLVFSAITGESSSFGGVSGYPHLNP